MVERRGSAFVSRTLDDGRQAGLRFKAAWRRREERIYDGLSIEGKE
jgi:hypothetical protein